DLMAPLGIWEKFREEAHLMSHGTCAVWGDEAMLENDFLFQTSAPGWRIDKNRFNRFLIQEAEQRGAVVQLGTTAKWMEGTDELFHFQITGNSGAVEDLHPVFVVDASGRTAHFASRMGAQKVRFDNLTGIWRFYELSTHTTDLPALVEACENGWWYSALLADNRLVVAFMTDSDLAPLNVKQAEKWEQGLIAVPHTQQRVAQAQSAGEIQVWPAASQYLDALCGEGWIAVGDAATTFDPLSAQGIFKAMKSGIFGAYAALDYLAGKTNALEKYEHLVRREYENYLEIRTRFYQQEQRWPHSVFWQRRHHWVTLSPLSILVSSKTPNRNNLQAKYFLSRKEEAFILETCSIPRPAKEVVEAFRQASLGYKKDHNIILALQFLLQKNILKQVS
ncbi:MAG: FAD-dependent monooxygenase, partial [Saprospiraceae bacterium]